MRFEWDEAKNSRNIRKHGVDFADVKELFDHPVLTWLDQRNDYEEERWISVGWIKTLVGVVVYTERQGDVIRIISARKATKHEVRRYEQSIQN